MVSVPATLRSLVPGSNIGPGPSHRVVCEAADLTVNTVPGTVQIKKNKKNWTLYIYRLKVKKDAIVRYDITFIL